MFLQGVLPPDSTCGTASSTKKSTSTGGCDLQQTSHFLKTESVERVESILMGCADQILEIEAGL